MLKWIGSLLLGLGAVAWLSSRASARPLAPNRPPMGPMLWKLSLLPSGWAGYLGAYSFANVRINSGTQDDGSRVGAGEMFGAADAAGLARHGWGWGYLRDAAAATAEGTKAGQLAQKYGITVYVLNAEKHAFGKEGEPAPADIRGNFERFAAAFRAHAPGVLLSYGGYSQAMVGSSILDQIVGLFDVWGPMVYGTKRSTIAKKWRNEHDRARGAGKLYAPIVGSGRFDPGAGYWGFTYSDQTSPGLLDLQAQSPADWIQPFIGGGGAGDMLIEGNDVNPALYVVAQEVGGAAVS